MLSADYSLRKYFCKKFVGITKIIEIGIRVLLGSQNFSRLNPSLFLGHLPVAETFYFTPEDVEEDLNSDFSHT